MPKPFPSNILASKASYIFCSSQLLVCINGTCTYISQVPRPRWTYGSSEMFLDLIKAFRSYGLHFDGLSQYITPQRSNFMSLIVLTVRSQVYWTGEPYSIMFATTDHDLLPVPFLTFILNGICDPEGDVLG